MGDGTSGRGGGSTGAGVPRGATPHAVVTLVVLAAAVTVVSVLALLVAGPTGGVGFYYVLRTLLAAVVVLAVVRRRAGSAHRRRLASVPWVAAPALLAYLVVPSTWTGLTFFGQALLGPPLGTAGVVVAVVLDGLVWAGLVVVALRWAARRDPLRLAPPTPYG